MYSLTHIRVVPDDRAVSPVVGVVMTVAITVILAAVVGAFVLELGEGREPAPQASFSTVAVADGGSARITIYDVNANTFTGDWSGRTHSVAEFTDPTRARRSA